MFPLPSSQNTRRGFTLIELLTVMAIIAVLIGLLLPVTGAVMNNARKTQASSDMARILASVGAYQADYGKLPLNTANLGHETLYGDPNGLYTSYNLFNILRAISETTLSSGNKYNYDNQLNPKQVVYFEAPNAKNPNNPRSGFLTKDFTNPVLKYKMLVGALVDPWGSEYIVWMDGSGSSDINVAIKYIYSYTPIFGPRVAYAATSLGPDGTLGTKGDKKLEGSDEINTW